MGDKEDHNHQEMQSDSDDESDEDFCPENEAESDVSDDENDDGEEYENNDSDNDYDENDHKKSKRPKTTKSTGKSKIKKRSKIKQKQKGRLRLKTTKSLNADDDNAVSSGITEHDDNRNKSSNNGHSDDNDENEKKKSDALWADFLSDVSQTSKPLPSSCANSSNDVGKELPVKTATMKENQIDSSGKTEKIKVTKVFDFAGEEIKIEEEISVNEAKKLNAKSMPNDNMISASSNSSGNNNDKQEQKQTADFEENKSRPSLLSIKNPQKPLINSLKRPFDSGSSGSGLGSVLGQVGKKTKISVLEKSKLDWNSFKQKEGLTEELQTFNKGKDGYLGRQDFLQRTDLRQFEIESSLRKANRSSKR